jgi:carboxypeptidase C (cathepsin A)
MYFWLLILPFLAFAQLEDVIKSLFEQIKEKTPEAKKDDFVITKHTIEIDGKPFHYNAIAGTLEQYTPSGEVSGRIFFTAYLQENGSDERPITFIYDGGPGGSSLALHIGAFGPRRLALPEEGQKRLPPYQIIDNPETLLSLSDLVMVDPIDTGYSQAGDQYRFAYFGVETDLFSFSEFIRMFCIHFNRWNAPKYLIGTSYGTCRSCGLAESLSSMGIHLSGIILLSSALDLSISTSTRDLSLPDCLLLPTLAATSWYHHRTMQNHSLEETIEYARRFANEEYASAMHQPLSPREQLAFYQKIANLIGLPLDTIRRFQGRIDEHTYTTEFLATDRKRLGGLDSRYVGEMSSLGSEYIEDPSYNDILPAFYPAFLNYLQKELEMTSYFPKYRSFSLESFLFWDWRTYDNPLSMPNFLQRLRRTLVTNPSMKVFVGSGLYDLRTPFFATEYTLSHLDLPHRANLHPHYYPSGHAFIFDLFSLRKLKKDLEKFYSN